VNETTPDTVEAPEGDASEKVSAKDGWSAAGAASVDFRDALPSHGAAVPIPANATSTAARRATIGRLSDTPLRVRERTPILDETVAR
jgi:hypothetical protein